MKLPVRITVILVFLICAALAIAAATGLQEGLPLEDLAPDDSYLRSYLFTNEKYFRGDSATLHQIVSDPDYDYSDIQNQKDIEQLTVEVAAFKFTVPQSTFSWLRAYHLWLSNSTHANQLIDGRYPPSRATFYNWLSEFLALPTSEEWTEDLIIEQGSIRASRIRHTIFLFSPTDRIEALKFAKDTANESPVPAFLFAPVFIFVETDAIIIKETIQNVGLAVVAVFIINLVILQHPLTALIVAVVIGLIDCMLFGIMWTYGIRINAISVVNLIMAIGLAFDYTGHIAHAFMKSKEALNVDRAKEALSTLGVSVLNGAITTMLGVLTLAITNSTIFRTFFTMFFGIVLFGMLYGMMFLPSVLSFIGPKPLHDREAPIPEKNDP